MPVIEKEHSLNNKMVYEGEIELRFILANSDLQVDTRSAKIPFDYSVESLDDNDNINSNMAIEVMSKDFIIQDGGVI